MIRNIFKRNKKLAIYLGLIVFFSFIFLLADVKPAKAAFECVGVTCYGRKGENSGNFRARATDPEGDNIYYIFYWGDGNETRCPDAGFVASGTPCLRSHTWTNSGIFNIYTKAIDTGGNISPSSNIILLYISNLANFTKNVDKTSASVGETITYTLTFNIQDAPVRTLVVTDPIPANSTYQNGSATYDCPGGTGSGGKQGGNIVWNLGDRATGACTLVFRVTAQGGTIVDSAQASARNADTINSNTVTTFVGEGWFQTEWGDVHSDGSISNEEPSGRHSATYMVTAGTTITDFTSDELEEIENYNELQPIFAKVDLDGLIAGDYGERQNTNLNDWLGSDTSAVTKPLWRSDDPNQNVWYRSGDLNIANNKKDLFLERGGTIVVDGDLRIRGNVYYDPNFNCASVPVGVDCRRALPTVGFVVRGDLNIDSDVAHIVGNFYVLGTVNTGVSDERLMVEGLMVASLFNFQRDYVENNDSAEWIRYDGRALVNPPPGFLDPAALLLLWTQITPE